MESRIRQQQLGAPNYLFFLFALVLSCHASLINKKHIT